jgi:hypothetical protein
MQIRHGFPDCEVLSVSLFPAIIPSAVIDRHENAMQVRVYSKGKFYLIKCPDGTRVGCCAARSVPDSVDAHDFLLVPFRGHEIKIPNDLPELLPLLAEAGRFGLSLIGDPVPSADLAGAVCRNCNEDDVSWLSVNDDSNTVHRDNCGCEFGLDGQV